MDFDKDLDTRGLNCPLPILKAKKALADMASGEVLRVLSTDPASVAITLSNSPVCMSVRAFLALRMGSGQFRPRVSISLSICMGLVILSRGGAFQ